MNTRLLLALLAALITSLSPARAQVYERLFSFTDARVAGISSSPNKGRNPVAGLVRDREGNFYGTTSGGGALGYGTVFKMTPSGALTTLVEFTDQGTTNRGGFPFAGLVQGSDGNFYGTTSTGGAGFSGTVFKMTPAGVLTTLVEFTGNGATNKGSNPYASLVQSSSDGNFYGTTSGGGASGRGTIFKMTPTGVLTTLVQFTGNGATNKGSSPDAGLVQGSDGNFYGTTSAGGAAGFGTVFKMTSAGVLTTLVEFTGNGASNKGKYPEAGLTLGSDGSFYGTTSYGGAADHGTVFKMTAAGALTTLVEFTGNGAANRGKHPESVLVQGSDGDFYGVTSAGSAADYETVFKMTPAGVLTTLFEFSGTGLTNFGRGPHAGLVLGSDGSFYGATTYGGAADRGRIFKITSAGTLTTLVEFTGNGVTDQGRAPRAGLAQGSDGAFYGTTAYGGTADDHGTIFKVTPAGVVSTLVEFTGNGATNKGSYSRAGLVRGSDGDFYGTSSGGGASGNGTVFKVTPGGVLTTLVEFTNNGATNKGSGARAALVQGTDGDFYGTTEYGGASGYGTVFKMTPAGVLTTLVEFTGNGTTNKGLGPCGSLVQGSDGNFYGTTSEGGGFSAGTVFKMTPAGVLTTLVQFTDNGATNKGSYARAGLIMGSDGNLYGTTENGGASGFGTVFKMTPAGVLTTLVQFTGNGASNKGRGPTARLVQASDGNFYGTTSIGGGSDFGTVFKMTPAGVLTTLVEFSDSGNGCPRAELTQGADGALYGTTSSDSLNENGGTIYRLLFPAAPLLDMTNVTAQGSVSVVAVASVNARGAATAVSLEYGTDGVNFPPENTRSVAVNLTGYQTRLVGATLDALAPATTYFYRFIATNSLGTTVSAVQSFSTLAEPVVRTSPASEIAPTSARFNGTVNARNFTSTVVFEWGTDGNTFGNIAPTVPITVTGNTDVAVSAAVAGLPEGGTVFYRIRATNAAGTVISGVRSFSTVSVTTSNPLPEQVGVSEVTFRATIDTFGQAASVKFRYWADAAPAMDFETVAQTVPAISGPREVSARVAGLAENTSYSYRVIVELAGTETAGGVVGVTTNTNLPPVVVDDLVFYSGQVVVNPLANDTDANGDALLLHPVLVTPPNASRGVASVTSDRRFISYNPQFNVLDDDSLTYRAVDPLGLSADGRVRLVAFSKRAGLYGGRIVFGSDAETREGTVAVQVGGAGAISTSFMNWAGENFVLKGVFDQRGTFTRTLNSPTGTVLTLTLVLDPDAPRIVGSFEEREGAMVTASVPSFLLTKNAGTGGLAASGLRTGFLSPPAAQANVMADGFLRMTVGKDARRGARFAGRLPDGEPFLVSVAAQGRSYPLVKSIEQGGAFTGLVRALDMGSAARGMMGDLFWKKRASNRARFHRGGVETVLSLSGAAYPALERGKVLPFDLGVVSPNARLRLSGGDLAGSYRDLLLNVLPGSVQVVGPDPAQNGVEISLNKLAVKVDGANAVFSGRFLHPATGKPVPFEGAFRVPFDGQPGQGRGVFRGPSAAGAVQIEAN